MTLELPEFTNLPVDPIELQQRWLVGAADVRDPRAATLATEDANGHVRRARYWSRTSLALASRSDSPPTEAGRPTDSPNCATARSTVAR
jgi:hypothetical protein